MYFKQLELSGFKSFADRTKVQLEPGVTAIVGPNGCGKSNILDALRWVLGEQRARELRGDHMQDVIFNGSENRHPLGMSEVSVTFDNADSKLPVDFAEVQVTRRVYRSGESEYLINKAPCRLRDIQELFMDTGIGLQAYSMVGQGKMDLILSSKPDDRRYLFEEAAGIIKYKNRKRVATRRLDSAEQNLLRLTDIITEVERQMRSLKRQVNAAIRYRELSEELRSLEIRAAWLTFTQLTTEIKQLQKQFAQTRDRYEGMAGRVTTLEARREELGLRQLEVDRALLVRREGVHEIDSEMEKIERDIALLRQQVEFSKEQQDRAGREQNGLRERAAVIQERVEGAGAQVVKIRDRIASCEAALASKTEDHAGASRLVAETDARLETVRAQAAERMNTRARTLTELETIEANVETAGRQFAEICERITTISSRRGELAECLESRRGEESKARNALQELLSKREHLNGEQATKADALRNVHDRWQDLREKKSSLEARLGSLRELRDSYEGFATGVRAVMRMKADGEAGLSGIIGPVGDLLSVDKQYERAIEAALGGNINNVAVEDADAAKEAIALLKARSAGRVTFLPLDIIRGSDRPNGMEPFTKQQGVIGPAIDFVQYEERLEPAIGYLLYRTLVVETLDDAIRIARAGGPYPKLVTLDGEVVSPSGAVTGGRMRHESRGLLGRSAEIAELEKNVAQTGDEVKGLAAEGQELTQALDALSDQLKALEQEEHGLRETIGTVSVDIARKTSELDTLTQTGQDLDQQRDEWSKQREQLETKRREVAARANSMEHDEEALQQAIADAQKEASDAREGLAVRASELADLRVQQASLAQQADEAERTRLRETREREEALAEAERREQMAAKLKKEQATLEEKIALDIERSKALSETKEEARVHVVDSENERQGLLEEIESTDKELRELREGARESQATVHQLELDLRQREDRVGFFQERILSEYNLALASLTANDVGTDEHDDATRDEMVSDIRARLQRMGEVNLMAIEEFDELEKRHAFLDGQAQDLHQARENLLGVIERCDKKIRGMFLETFREVEENFHSYFRALFNGGQARIYLLDEDDPLESGIEIEARPPGKRPQSISLLSGGESAMTAIALLFSIFKAKPSPFCILDEVDAPLDDANIGRFLNMLDDFTSESQFVIITHNKQTMARAQALYGVTMQERGVSQLVSVRFDQVDDSETAA